ncbi:hypothetical protein [Haloprofundus marisrubri]|nr:hypothetical protein [Haloprofundus marisrubri]
MSELLSDVLFYAVVLLLLVTGAILLMLPSLAISWAESKAKRENGDDE